MASVVATGISCIMMALTIFQVMKNLLNVETRIDTPKKILLILSMAMIILLSYDTKYHLVSPVMYFLCIVLIYRNIFGICLTKSAITAGIQMAIVFLSDAIVSIVMVNITTVERMRSIWYYILTSNLLVDMISIGISFIPSFRKKTNSLISNFSGETYDNIIICLFLIMISLSILVGNISNNFHLNLSYFFNIVVMVIFVIILFFYLKEKNFSNKINAEYQMLWDHVEVYEDAIENDKLTRHEWKNTLGSIRNMTNNKKIIEKIDDILKDVRVIDDKWLEELKNLPKSTMKALLYYKISVARSKNIHITVDVSPRVKQKIKKIGDSKDCCNLLGIYIDNAIEAAENARKKEIAIEIYTLRDQLYFTISNTFQVRPDLDKMNKKGVSTKGKRRGNGLYFANKIIKKDPRFKMEQSIVKKYYITKLSFDEQ